jgi:hypothetical protein
VTIILLVRVVCGLPPSEDRSIARTSNTSLAAKGGPVVLLPYLMAAVSALPWLLGGLVFGLLATYMATVLVALFHPDPGRRSDARAVLDRHLFTMTRRRR